MGAGYLPFGGGAAEQPAYLMAAFDVLDGAQAKIEKRREEYRNLGRLTAPRPPRPAVVAWE